MSGIFKNLKNIPTPAKYKTHYFCDYIELLALANNDLLSKSDILNRLFENNSDENDSKVLEFFNILKSRSFIFKDYYPFEIKMGTVCSIELKSNLSNSHKKYIFLLLCSSLSYIKQKEILAKDNTLEKDFEKFSFETLKDYLPKNSKIYQFGQSTYSGTLQEKVDKLAKELNFITTYKPHTFNNKNRGDGGIDLIAWKTFPNDSDNNINIPLYLGQCAAGENWVEKQYQPKKFKNYINFESNVIILFFMPYDGRDENRNFIEEKDILIGENIFFDRVRLLNTIDSNYKIDNLKSYPLIEKAIEYKEDIV